MQSDDQPLEPTRTDPTLTNPVASWGDEVQGAATRPWWMEMGSCPSFVGDDVRGVNDEHDVD